MEDSCQSGDESTVEHIDNSEIEILPERDIDAAQVQAVAEKNIQRVVRQVFGGSQQILKDMKMGLSEYFRLFLLVF